MNDNKKNFTLESFQAERARLQKAVKERIKKRELEKKKKGNDLLRYLRLINEDDIKLFFLINEGGGDNFKRNLLVIAISYLFEEEIDFIDNLQMKDFINFKTIEDLKLFINKNVKINSNIKDHTYFLNKILLLIHEIFLKKKVSDFLYNISVGTIGYTLEIILKNFFDYNLYEKKFKGDLKIFSGNNLLEKNNILKKIDYLSYVKKSVDTGRGFINVNSDMLENSEIRHKYCQEYTPNGQYVWNDTSAEIIRVIKKTNLLFTGNENIYDDKNRLLKTRNYINGIYTGQSSNFYFDHYANLNDGYKTEKPKRSKIYVAENKIFSSFDKQPNNLTAKSEELFGEIYQYDVEGKVIEKFIKKNNLIFNVQNSKKKNISSSLLTLIENDTSSAISINKNEYFLIHLSNKDDVPIGEMDIDLDEYVANGGFGDINLIHDGQFNEIYEDEITSAKSGVQYNVLFNYRVVIGHYKVDEKGDKLVCLTLLKDSFFKKYNQSIDVIKNEDKYKALITYSENFLENEEVSNCLKKINTIYQEQGKMRYGLVPIFSNKISIVEGGNFNCDNGWHPYFYDQEYNFIQIILNKENSAYQELTDEDKENLEEVSKEYMDQP